MPTQHTQWPYPLTAALLGGLLLLSAPTPADNGDTTASACVTVEVDGYKALPYDCFQQKMTPASEPARDRPAVDSAGVVRQAPNRLGLFNLSTLRNRMGNTLGHGVKPQRPAPAPPPPLP